GFALANPLAWIPVLALVWFVISGLRLRARARRLPVVVGTAAGGAEAPRQWLLAEGLAVDEATRSAVAAYADRAGLDVLDLVPADLPFDAAFDLVHLVDARSYTRNRLAAGRGGGQAVVATPDVLERAGVKQASDGDERMDPVALLATSVRLKKYAPATSGLALVPGLRAAAVGGRRARLAALGIPVWLASTGPLVTYAALAVGTVANPVWGAAALVAFCLQPYIVFVGTPLRPRGLHLAALARLLWDPAHWLGTALGRRGVLAEEEAARKRAQTAESRLRYTADISAGVGRYLEPRRPDCPWCRSTGLSHFLTTPDLLQGKPGTFTLEQCGACRHIFQNPRLTVEGLEFYYRDFYDGLGESSTELVFSFNPQSYRDRAEMLRPHTTAPRSWLDVGTGHGHFCTVARDIWPETSFDGLDMSESIEEAERRGWVDRGFRGMFPHIADQIAGSYDVVSMSHYLEHTREPFEELDAAAKALVPGGHLMIEVPDPEWPMGRILKRFWFPWFQPQHQHLIPMANLKEALATRGLLPVSEERSIQMKIDLSGALFLLLLPLVRDPDTSWFPRPAGPGRRIVRAAATAAGAPLLVLAVVLDHLLSVPLRRSGKGVAYRVVARKVDSPESPMG
ncbi:MAG TPA: class I SAM-dependent methyltransferase, partial [Actinomycetota bacterium]|nr:class I SAM-dependent methyltransferase [Actinomycetota bacterium]